MTRLQSQSWWKDSQDMNSDNQLLGPMCTVHTPSSAILGMCDIIGRLTVLLLR